VFERKALEKEKYKEMAEASSFSTPCVPKFDGDYDHWSLLIKNLF